MLGRNRGSGYTSISMSAYVSVQRNRRLLHHKEQTNFDGLLLMTGDTNSDENLIGYRVFGLLSNDMHEHAGNCSKVKWEAHQFRIAELKLGFDSQLCTFHNFTYLRVATEPPLRREFQAGSMLLTMGNRPLLYRLWRTHKSLDRCQTWCTG